MIQLLKIVKNDQFVNQLLVMCPLVSVIVPNYNHAKYLDVRINSILNQTFHDFELIILDDCSTDNSRDVIENYRNNPHVSQVVFNETNSGLIFKQWEKGIELAKGELIWIAESDDSCCPEMLEVLVHEFRRNKRCVLAYCKSTVILGDKLQYSPKLNKIKSLSLSGTNFIKYFMSCGNDVANASSALFKKDAAKSINKDYYEYKGAGDRLFWIYLSELGAVSIIRNRLNIFRQHGDNSTAKYFYQGINQIEDKKILDYLYAKGYIGIILLFLSRIRYCNSQVVGRSFATKEIKKEVEACWNLNVFEFICIKIYRIFYAVYKLFRLI